MKQQTFTREEVINLINEILENPDSVMDAITNEYTDFDGEELLEMVENNKLKIK